MNADIVTAIAAIITALIALAIAVFEGRQRRASTKLDVLLRLDDQWNGESMKRARIVAAESLKAGLRPDDGVDSVLDFFQGIGSLDRRGLIDRELAWEFFFYWLHRYVALTADHIRERQNANSALWLDVRPLHEKLSNVARKRSPRRDSANLPSPKELQAFIEEELTL
ncbi:hypothetical protein ACTRXD_19710 [Nitrospira sp. T9]|uniref:hypothetical protein n=1 Tax=unclassified Nitrospira TaxID=2652172 RepID=UPI003F984158